LRGAVASKAWRFPFIVKARSAGYDGKGVFLVEDQADLENIPAANLLAEEIIDIEKELSVIVARNNSGQISSYPPAELFMDKGAYLVNHLISPANIPDSITHRAEEMAHELIEAFDIKGLLAIEMFLDHQGNIWINECSPRPHNSGHNTIEGALTSQYEQHLRGIFNLPLGSCETIMPSAMINLLGEVNSSGPASYEGLTECLKLKGVKVHIYGKQETRPRRKMGHITVLHASLQKLESMVEQIKNQVKVTSWNEK
jgi:5-(carboxyamino)imidazole ribonucleotide synthase